MKRIFVFALVVLMAAVPVWAQDDAVNPAELDLSGTPEDICEAATPAIEPETREYAEAEQVLEAGINYQAILCTSAGAVYVDLFEAFTPLTVNNFVYLAEQNYYNNTIFHRVMEDFMAQAGDPTGTGTGGPGYRFADEFVGFINFDEPGMLAMANSGENTNGSQFFITTANTEWLHLRHTIFGEVLSGQADTVDNIQLRDPEAGGDATTLETVVIIRDPDVVEAEITPAADVADAETVQAGLENAAISQGMPEGVAFTVSDVIDTETVAANAPDDLQADYEAFLDEYGHEYRVDAAVEVAQCDPEAYYFTEMRYAVDAFESAERADAALSDPFLADYYESVGYTPVDVDDPTGLDYAAYAAETDGCDDTVTILTLDLQRGRYVVNMSLRFSSTEVELAEAAQFIARSLVTFFETGLDDAYRSELR